LLTPTVSAAPDNFACIRSCNRGYVSCVSGCGGDSDCHWWCYDLWLTCIDACSAQGKPVGPCYA
jgi:hypothetical protein